MKKPREKGRLLRNGSGLGVAGIRWIVRSLKTPNGQSQSYYLPIHSESLLGKEIARMESEKAGAAPSAVES